MILLSTTAPVRWTPPWRKDEPDAPVYLIRAGSVIEREMLEAELAGEHRAGKVFDFHLLAAFGDGISTLLADDPEHSELIALAQQQVQLKEGEKLAPADQQKLAEARAILAQHWPEYRELVAQNARRQSLAPLLAFRRFVVGWENVKADFAKGADGMVSLDAMAALPSLELRTAGTFAYRLLSPAGELGNFARPSSSDSGPAISSSDASSPAVGKSKASGGKKTRSTRSRRGLGAS